ncbi:phospholipase B1, membrane-associated-like [Chrysoperla carnea]|uniref:phospholipase B1, membrane-associated-like n=1 Tax=Chrysoperla carnea TaxID=189513 RepID=UPI001D0754C5|nr:phospholipase B1, membrane-associated-like [Chrysoperla carnea]
MRSGERPKSVHKLRPGDIDVIAAIGDSLTAGLGIVATNLIQLVIENRGLSWCIGGLSNWRQFLTLPNILKEFNPNLIGYSIGDGASSDKISQFNVAVTGASSRDMVSMAEELKRRLRNDPRIDFQNDWKLITMMIGPNDFCVDICYEKDKAQYTRQHRIDLIKVFRYIRDNIPRTFINYVLMPDMEILTKLTNNPSYCYFVRTFECSCLFGEHRQKALPEIFSLVKQWRQIEIEVTQMEEFTNHDTFTVVLQPYTQNVTFPVTTNNLTDSTYLSSDCYHMSQKMHALNANGLWNNMIEPTNRKSLKWPKNFMGRFLCPNDSSPYLRTKRNSDV